ncbi:DNA mismatch repair protein Mlh3-like isoform X1 [Eleutherodactylus coqui]|uniref:DNA mismatch repair protein Mlh3-like isoform X1 n=1 Tax=Eleutherodactylus coqui TaxID=57060 RepID=UPI003462D3F3
MIRALAEDVKCRLRSGVAITSVAQCVEELLLNSADAEATCLAVRVDLETFNVQVVDNGCGLCYEDMERVGIRYFTSKCHSVKDLENLRFYGFRGEAIASMVSAASVVEICSKHKGTNQTFSRLFRNGKPHDVVEAESPRPSAGTTITIYNLFSNLPVRRKCLDPVLELERIRQRVEAISLVKPSISFSLRNDAVCSVLLQLPKTKDSCSRFCQIYGLSRSQSLREVWHIHSGYTMHGLISCEGHYNRTMQFLYVNNRLVLKTKLHKLIDFIVRRESSICRLRSSCTRSAANYYGIFVVNIQCPMSEYDICFQPDKTLIEFQDWDKVMLCVEQGLRSFLKKENLYLEPSKDDVAEFSQKHHYNLSYEAGDQLVPPQDPGRGTSHTSDSVNLRSKSVLRSNVVTEAGSPTPPLGEQNYEAVPENRQLASLPTDVPETLIKSYDFVCDEGKKVSDAQEITESHGGSLLAPPATSTIHKTVMVPNTVSCEETINKNTISSEPQNPASHSTGSQPLQRDIHKPAACKITLISPKTQYSMSSENHKCGAELTHIHLSAATSLGGTLDRFRKQYGKRCLAARDCQESQLCKRPGYTKLTSLKHCVGTGMPTSASIQENQEQRSTVLTTNPEKTPATLSDFVGLKQSESQNPQCTPTLTTKLCMLKNMQETSSGGGHNLTPSTPPVSNICEDGGLQFPFQQQAALDQGGQTSENSPDGSTSHKWLQCYEESLGKNVFINTTTGLSSYSAPIVDKKVACTKDLSNMAVNVVCSNGFQYQCHPFKSQAIIPFLPRPCDERGPAEQTDNGALSLLYAEWKNPVYVRHPALAVDVSQECSNALSVKIHNILYPYRFTKEMVHSMKVLQQVDSKFIACLMNSETGQKAASGGHLLVLVDQHAAHERVRLEQLITDSFESSSEACKRHLKVSAVEPALEIQLSEEDCRVLRPRAAALRRAGLSLSFPATGSPCVLVSEIPLCFVEREANELQRGRTPVVNKIVEEYLQEQVQLLQVPGAGNGAVPGTVFKVLASQACHGAVKFNQSLTMDECRHLIRALAQCSLPFQCAHGRPSILPLADLQHMAPEPEVPPRPNLQRLRRHYQAWQLYK